jgi:hypothetical protein
MGSNRYWWLVKNLLALAEPDAFDAKDPLKLLWADALAADSASALRLSGEPVLSRLASMWKNRKTISIKFAESDFEHKNDNR